MKPTDTQTKTLNDISSMMRHIDFALLSTKAEDGSIASRPMSNNRDVDYNGDSFFFTTEDSRMVSDIGAEGHVGLGYTGGRGLLGRPPVFVTVEGEAELIRDKAIFAEHWQPSLERWFQQGIDTPGLVLIKVHAQRVAYWDGEEHGEVELPWVAAAARERSKTMLGAGTALSDI